MTYSIQISCDASTKSRLNAAIEIVTAENISVLQNSVTTQQQQEAEQSVPELAELHLKKNAF